MVLKNWYKWLSNTYYHKIPELINYEGSKVTPPSMGIMMSSNAFKNVSASASPLAHLVLFSVTVMYNRL